MARWNNHLQTQETLKRVKRDAVLREARASFGKRGYHNTSLDDIAQSLKVSKGTLYNYVKDKQELLYECHALALDIGERAISLGRRSGGSGLEILRETLRHNIVSLADEFGAFAVLIEIDALRPEDRTIVVERRDGIERQMVEIVRKGIDDGSIRPVDPKIAVMTLMGVINWLPRWYSPTGRLSGADIARQISDLLLCGLDARVVRPQEQPQADTPPQPK